MENDGGMIPTGENRRTWRRTCPRATLSTTNPMWIDQGANPGLRGERPATNSLSHGTTQQTLTQDDRAGVEKLRSLSNWSQYYVHIHETTW
jgi:hypothetical protein